MYLKDYVKEFDYYSPVIIANNDYLKDNKEEARKVIQAIKKGYQYAMEHPEEAADILIKNAPELKENVTLSSNLKNTCQKNTQATRKNGVNLTQLAGMLSINGIKKMVSLKKT